MGLLDAIVQRFKDLVDAIVDVHVSLGTATIETVEDAPEAADRFFTLFRGGDAETDQASEDLGELINEFGPGDEIAGFFVDALEEQILAPFDREGEITPDNVEALMDNAEGSAAAQGIGFAMLISLVEAIPFEDIDQGPSEIYNVLLAQQVGEWVGREATAMIQEGVDPALKQNVHRRARSKQADFKDFSEANLRAKWTDGEIPTRQGDLPEEVRDLFAPNDFGWLPDPDTYGTIPDQTDLYEWVALEHLEPEELFEELPQKGVVPSRASVEQILNVSGLPEDIKEGYLTLHDNIPRSQALVQEGIRLEEPVRVLDERVFEGAMTPEAALAHVENAVRSYVTVADAEGNPIGEEIDDETVENAVLGELFARWRSLDSMPSDAPSDADVERWYRQGIIGPQQFQELNDEFGTDPRFFAEKLVSNTERAGEDDIRKQFVLNRISHNQAINRLRLLGWNESQAAEILAGADPDDLVQQATQAVSGVEGQPVSVVPGIGEARSFALQALGVSTVADLAETDVETVTTAVSVGDQTATRWITLAQRAIQRATGAA